MRMVSCILFNIAIYLKDVKYHHKATTMLKQHESMQVILLIYNFILTKNKDKKISARSAKSCTI